MDLILLYMIYSPTGRTTVLIPRKTRMLLIYKDLYK